jgi:hypothetical protein
MGGESFGGNVEQSQIRAGAKRLTLRCYLTTAMRQPENEHVSFGLK